MGLLAVEVLRMSETKFTPGQWTVQNWMHLGEGWKIVSDHKFPGGRGTTHTRFVAQYIGTVEDANLLSASRDLYAALQNLLGSFVEDLMETGYDEADLLDYETVVNARAALAKARGES